MVNVPVRDTLVINGPCFNPFCFQSLQQGIDASGADLRMFDVVELVNRAALPREEVSHV